MVNQPSLPSALRMARAATHSPGRAVNSECTAGGTTTAGHTTVNKSSLPTAENATNGEVSATTDFVKIGVCPATPTFTKRN